jgi:hypothetical protein
MSVRRLFSPSQGAARTGRALRLGLAVVPLALGSVVALPGGVANAIPVSAPTCGLTGITDGIPGSMQLTAQDPTSGIKSIVSPYHINASRTFSGFTAGTTNPVTAEFTQTTPGYGSSGSLAITNTAGEKTVCLGQFKYVISGARAGSTGFTFPQDRNFLVIQNGSAGLTSVEINVNGSTHFKVTLTPNETYGQDLSAYLHGFPPLNTLVLTGEGPSGSSAEAVVWGVGPFVYGYPQ